MIRSFRTNKSLYNLQFNYRVSDVIIPIAMSLDDEYTYPTIVSITSILVNSNSNTKYNFYILHPSSFTIQNKKKLKSLEKKYKRCFINFYDMKNFLFKKIYKYTYIFPSHNYFQIFSCCNFNFNIQILY